MFAAKDTKAESGIVYTDAVIASLKKQKQDYDTVDAKIKALNEELKKLEHLKSNGEAQLWKHVVFLRIRKNEVIFEDKNFNISKYQPREQATINALKEILGLINKKFGIERIYGKYDICENDNIVVEFSCSVSAYRNGKEVIEGQSAIDFLKNLGDIKINPGNGHMTVTSVSLTRTLWESAIKALTLLATPTPEQIAVSQKGMLSAKC